MSQVTASIEQVLSSFAEDLHDRKEYTSAIDSGLTERYFDGSLPPCHPYHQEERQIIEVLAMDCKQMKKQMREDQLKFQEYMDSLEKMKALQQNEINTMRMEFSAEMNELVDKHVKAERKLHSALESSQKTVVALTAQLDKIKLEKGESSVEATTTRMRMKEYELRVEDLCSQVEQLEKVAIVERERTSRMRKEKDGLAEEVRALQAEIQSFRIRINTKTEASAVESTESEQTKAGLHNAVKEIEKYQLEIKDLRAALKESRRETVKQAQVVVEMKEALEQQSRDRLNHLRDELERMSESSSHWQSEYTKVRGKYDKLKDATRKKASFTEHVELKRAIEGLMEENSRLKGRDKDKGVDKDRDRVSDGGKGQRLPQVRSSNHVSSLTRLPLVDQRNHPSLKNRPL